MHSPHLPVHEHGRLRYLLRVSEEGTAPHPVLVFLHGYDEGAPMDIHHALTLHGPLRLGDPTDALSPFIIIAPQMPVRGDVWYRYADAVQAIVQQVHETHAGDPQRTYLTGFSFGGNGVLDLALLQPRTWAALWAVDPTRVPTHDPGIPLWLSIGEIARFRGRAFANALRLRPADSDLGLDRLYLDQGADHVGAARLAYSDARIYAWLLTKQLAEVTAH
jgi:alpha-beta hydrolase superfamily lysophospholipase